MPRHIQQLSLQEDAAAPGEERKDGTPAMAVPWKQLPLSPPAQVRACTRHGRPRGPRPSKGLKAWGGAQSTAGTLPDGPETQLWPLLQGCWELL